MSERGIVAWEREGGTRSSLWHLEHDWTGLKRDRRTSANASNLIVYLNVALLFFVAVLFEEQKLK